MAIKTRTKYEFHFRTQLNGNSNVKLADCISSYSQLVIS